jgi:penicillin-insensitive murein DD-endopeptidase
MRASTVSFAALLALALPLSLYAQAPAATDTAPKADAAKKAAPAAPGKSAAPAAGKTKETKPAPPKSPAAKQLFGAAKTPAPLAARAIGFYAKGCLAGAAALPIDGPAWQAMRLSRNRNWGHPDLIALVEKLGLEAQKQDNWPGLLVGDLSQPRGGPMLTGHASHQIGLDADIWLTPMPNRRLSAKEREDLSATSMLAADNLSVDPKIWTEAHVRLVKRAASYRSVERVLVHPAIKKALCDATANDKDRTWLHKVRPIWGHYYHFHIRIACPKGSTNCETQPAPANDDGCGKELTDWLALVKTPPKPSPPGPPKAPMTIDQLPADCRAVLASGPDGTPVAAPAAKATKSTAVKKPTVSK